jgi:regulator of sirC expression with transglutaminase-like and TPR domain
MPNQIEKQNLNEKEIRGFVNLLQDTDDKILKLMADQLCKFDDSTLKNIERITLDIADRNNDEDLIDNWYQVSKIALLNQIQEWKKTYDLEKGLLLISRLKNPGLEEEKYQSQLDNYAARVRAKLSVVSKQYTIIDALNEVLYREEGFVGNQADYYDINNNFLHTALEYRTGNPIMLSVIYILVARRLGIDIRGVGTPGHFIVQYEDRYYDPFFAGKEITKEECVLRSQELSVFWRDEYLDQIDDKHIMARCIRNLIAIYKKLNEYDKAEDATSILRMV